MGEKSLGAGLGVLALRGEGGRREERNKREWLAGREQVGG